MKSKQRRVVKGILNHCYQRTVGGEVIFYCISDYLHLFTILCVVSRKYHVNILAISLMPDHIHQSVVADNKRELSAFISEYSRRFSREHGAVCHKSGQLFEHPYGSVPKYGDKKARSNLIYVGNNPPERQLCRHAEDYRWTFLAYAESPNPFSKPLVIRESSFRMKKAVSEVKTQFLSGRPMAYGQLKRLFSSLDAEEKEQLTDYIIATYNVIDYQSAIRFFGSYREMLTAMHSSTGNEYNLNEVFIGKSDTHYSKMATILLRKLKLNDIHDFLSMSEDERFELFLLLRQETEAPGEQIAAFLQIPLRKV